MLTPREVRALLERHGLSPRKALGQNYVTDANTIRKVIRDAQVRPGERVCEVGPGLGSLTVALREAGAEVVAIELDPAVVPALREVLGDDREVEVVIADAARVDFASVVGRADALVANLPYNAATPIVMRALTAGVFGRLLVMVQKEVGIRWAARVGDPLYAGVSVKIAALADVRVVGPVSRRAFHPVPGVDSVTVALRPRPWTLPVDRDALFAVVQAGFAQRRKRLRNALAALGQPATVIEGALVAAGLDPGARAEELDLQAWARLTEALGDAREDAAPV